MQQLDDVKNALEKEKAKNKELQSVNIALQKSEEKYKKLYNQLCKSSEETSEYNENKRSVKLKNSVPDKNINESEAKFRVLFENANDAIVLIDFESNYFFKVNQKAIKLFGYSAAEFDRMQLKDLYQDNADLKNHKKLLKQLLDEGHSEIIETLYSKKGRILHVKISADVIEIEHQKYIQAYIKDESVKLNQEGKIRDINEQLQVTLEKINRAEQIGNIAFYEYDFNEKQSWISKNFYLMLGYEPEQINKNSPETIFDLISEEDKERAAVKFYKVVEYGGGYECLCKLKTSNGLYRNVEITGNVLKSATGLPYKLTAIVKDVDHLKKQERKFREVFNSILDLYFEEDLKGNIVLVSPSVKTILGVEPEKLIGSSFENYFKHSDQKKKLFDKIINNSVVTHEQIVMLNVNNEEVILEVNGNVRKNENDEVIGVRGVGRIINERVDKEKELLLYMNRLEEAEKAGNLGIYELDLKRKKLWWSSERYKMLGEEPFSFEPTLEKFASYVNENDFRKLSDSADKAILSGGRVEEIFRLTDRQGNEKICFSQGKVIKDVNGHPLKWLGVDVDVTELYHKQEKLDEKLRLEEAMLNTMTEGVVIYDESLKPIIFNKRAHEILLLTVENFKEKSFDASTWKKLKIVNHNDVPLKYEDFPIARIFNTKESVQNFVIGIKITPSRSKWLKINANYIELFDDNGQLKPHVIVSYSDYSDTIEKEKINKVFAASFLSMTEGIIIQDKNDIILGMNDAACDILGLSSTQLREMDSYLPAWRAITTEGKKIELDDYPPVKVMNTGKAVVGLVMGIHNSNNSLSWISVSSSPIYFDNNQLKKSPDATVTTFSDVTDKQINTERQMLASQISQMYVLSDDVNSNFKHLLHLLVDYCRGGYAEYWRVESDQEIKCFMQYYEDRIFKKLKAKAGSLTSNTTSFPLAQFFKKSTVGYVKNLEQFNNEVGDEYKDIGIENLLGVPIAINKQVKGVILIYNTKLGQLSDNDAIMLTNLGAQIFQYSERVDSHNKLLDTLKEKEFLFREVHHRVKNNLQLIVSTLYLRVHSIDDARFKEKIDDIIASVKSIALIHEQLMQSDSVNTIEISSYIEKLANEIPMSLVMDASKLDIKTNFINKIVSMDFAVNFGLLINELMANSIKHAFKGVEQGTIFIQLKKQSAEIYQLKYKDNGIGIDEKFLTLESSESLGMNLINSFSSQLKANVKISNRKGTEYIFTFKMN